MSSKDYLDVSSEEEPTKNILEKKFKLKNDNNITNNDYSNHSCKNGEKYENKYYHKNRKERSRSRHKYYNKSRSRSNNYRNKRYNYSPRKSESNSSSNLSNYSKNKKYHKYNRNRSESSYSNSYSKDKYSYKNKDKKSKNIYEKERYKNNNNSESSNSYHNNLQSKKYDEQRNNYNKKEKDKKNKWTDGEKKEEFKQIKIEKYDKNKRLNEINKEKEKEKEISKLKKELKEKEKDVSKIEIEKEKPNFEPSGILLKDLEYEYNKTMNNKIIINYNPPSDSIIPNENEIWFLFKFSEDKNEAEETYKLIEKEFFLIGKDPRICDIRIKQKNISRQHAVIQFRKIKKEKEWEILPYLIDLNSTNGTYLNGDKIDNKKYYELRDKDELNFGDKKIDFVLMKTNQIFN